MSTAIPSVQAGMTRRALLVPAVVLLTTACVILDEPSHGLSSWIFVLLGVLAVILVLRRGRNGAPPASVSVLEGSPLATPRAGVRTPPSTEVMLREGLVLGLTGFGGGLAVLSHIEERLLERRRWIQEETFLESAALAQSLPGAVAFNALGFLGLRLSGVRGALAMVTGFVTPSFLILLTFALAYPHLRRFDAVASLFHTLNPAVAGLVASTALRIGGRVVLTPTGEPGGWRGLVADRWSAAIVATAAAAVALFGFGVVEVLLGAGIVGLLRHLRPGARLLDAVEVRWRWLRWRVWVTSQSRLARKPPWWRGSVEEDEIEMLGVAPAGLLAAPMAIAAARPMWLLVEPTFTSLLERVQLLGSLSGIFLRAGALTFGGGFVMIPLLEAELVQARGWLAPHAFADAMALGQITPGPVVITATFVGYTIAGLAGALLSTIAVFLPAFALVLLVGSSIERFRQTLSVQAFLQGLQPAIVGVMIAASISLARNGITDGLGVAVGIVSFALLWRWRLNPMWVVLGAALLGLLVWQAKMLMSTLA